MTLGPLTIPNLSTLEILHEAITSVCPIDGVSVPDWADNTTWVIVFDPSSTAAQQQAAQTLLASFNPVSLTYLLSALTLAEYKGIMAAAAADIASATGTGQLSQWLDVVRVQGWVNLGDPLTTSVQEFLVGNNLLTAARAAAVFAPPVSG
jgi:hypothetical protein